MKKVPATLLMFLIAVLFLVAPELCPAEWTGDMTVGASSISGNTNGKAMSVNAQATQTTLDERYTVAGEFNYAEESDTLTARNSRGSLKYDKFITPKLYALLNLELSKDEMRNVDMLTTIGPGIGYQVADNLRFEGGLSYNNKDVSIGNDEQWTAARLSMYSKDNFTNALSLANLFTWNPSLEDFGDYTLRNKLDLAYAFSDKWSGKLTQVIQYDKTPSPGVEPLDKTLTAGLQYNF